MTSRKMAMTPIASMARLRIENRNRLAAALAAPKGELQALGRSLHALAPSHRTVHPPLVYAFFRMARGLTLGVRAVVTDPPARSCWSSTPTSRAGTCPAAGSSAARPPRRPWSANWPEEAGVKRPVTPAPGLGPQQRGAASRRPRPGLPRRGLGALRLGRGRRDPRGRLVRSVDDLPEETTKATRRRIAEALGGAGSGSDVVTGAHLPLPT
jgi:hypothetical protein